MEKRSLGRTGERLSVVGFGGIVVMDEEPQSAAAARGAGHRPRHQLLRRRPILRQRRGAARARPWSRTATAVFLACKTEKRSRDEAARGAEATRWSTLRTDHFDLYQFHAVTTLAEVEQIFGPGGAMEAFLEARDKGLIRLHRLLRPHARRRRWRCWTASPSTPSSSRSTGSAGTRASSAPRCWKRAEEKGVGPLALKALAKRELERGRSQRVAQVLVRAGR